MGGRVLLTKDKSTLYKVGGSDRDDWDFDNWTRIGGDAWLLHGEHVPRAVSRGNGALRRCGLDVVERLSLRLRLGNHLNG